VVHATPTLPSPAQREAPEGGTRGQLYSARQLHAEAKRVKLLTVACAVWQTLLMLLRNCCCVAVYTFVVAWQFIRLLLCGSLYVAQYLDQLMPDTVCVWQWLLVTWAAVRASALKPPPLTTPL